MKHFIGAEESEKLTKWLFFTAIAAIGWYAFDSLLKKRY